jgi:hypothetical protein
LLEVVVLGVGAGRDGEGGIGQGWQVFGTEASVELFEPFPADPRA